MTVLEKINLLNLLKAFSQFFIALVPVVLKMECILNCKCFRLIWETICEYIYLFDLPM